MRWTGGPSIWVVLGLVALCYVAAGLGAETLNLTPLPPAQVAYTERMHDADLENARDICFQYSWPTGTLMACVPANRMCNRSYKWPECWGIDKEWVESGAAARAEARRQTQEITDHTAVLRAAGSKSAP